MLPPNGGPGGVRGYRGPVDGLWAPIITIAILAAILGAFPWLAARVRSRGIGGGVFEPIQDMWDPTVHRTQIELHAQAEREAPAPSPDDPPEAGQLKR